ncbi:MAG TPA: acyltransferase domain-containing protein [Geobacteraceae bacterium]|nr:acyltransferase domain-containing protein [Geobacteraceae bacterium]
MPDDEDFAGIAEIVRSSAKFNLEDFSWLGEEEPESVKLQVYGVSMSLYTARRLGREGARPDLIAEHSMGIYPSLAVCGAIAEEDAVELTFRVGRSISRMGKTGEYALCCIVGLAMEPVLSIAENNGVYPANLNTSRHFLLSGERRAAESAEAEALAAGAFSVKLFPCDAPLHTPLMSAVESEMREIFSGYRYRDPAVPLMNHIDQDYLAAGDIADFMMRELTLPVYWENSYRALRKAGVTRFFEVGAGDSLKKYNRWIESEAARR